MRSAFTEFSRRRPFGRQVWWQFGSDEPRVRGVSGWLTAIGVLLLAGCSLGPVISEHSIDYNETVETVTNSVLVTNILRARDGAPLYFTDLSQIRGSLGANLQAGQTTIPYAHFLNSSTPSTYQGGPLTLSTAPGFDFAPLNTKKFAEGILNGIDEKTFAYFIERGVNPKVFLNIVVGRIERYRKIGPDKYGSPDTCLNGCVQAMIADWTKTSSGQPVMGRLSTDAAFGPPIPAEILAKQDNVLSDLVKVDKSDLDLKEDKKKNSYRLSKSTASFVLCVVERPGGSYHAVGIAAQGATKDADDPPIPSDNGTCSNAPIGSIRYVIYTRSVENIFYYLGGIVKHPETSPIPFFIYDYPVEGTRFHTSYRGKTYFVREMIVAENTPVDATITILAILNDLLNLNRDADEIPSTKTVATSP